VLFNLYAVGVLIGVIGFAVHNQSVIIWRIFHAELKIISPYISPMEERILLSRFSSVKARSDYLPIQAQLESTAKANNVTLPKLDLW
jgi:hypothetical protein